MSTRDHWRTPPNLLRFITHAFGPIHVDVAATPENTVARDYWTEQDDALKIASWRPKQYQKMNAAGLPVHAFCNPPYSNTKRSSIGAWIVRAVVMAESRYVSTTMLVHAGIGAAWFQDYAASFESVYLLTPRVQFIDPNPAPGVKRQSNDRDSILIRITPLGLDTPAAHITPLDWRAYMARNDANKNGC